MADALSSLVALTSEETPRATFMAELRDRLAMAAVPILVSLVRTPTFTEVSPPMSQIITPYLCVADGKRAMAWYRSAFGASVSNVFEDSAEIGHAELEFGGAVFYLADEYPEIGVVAPIPGAGATTSFVVLVAYVDAFIDRAVTAGATLQRPITEGHGTRSG